MTSPGRDHHDFSEYSHDGSMVNRGPYGRGALGNRLPPDRHGAKIARNPLLSPTCFGAWRDLFPWTASPPTLGSFRVAYSGQSAVRYFPEDLELVSGHSPESRFYLPRFCRHAHHTCRSTLREGLGAIREACSQLPAGRPFIPRPRHRSISKGEPCGQRSALPNTSGLHVTSDL